MVDLGGRDVMEQLLGTSRGRGSSILVPDIAPMRIRIVADALDDQAGKIVHEAGRLHLDTQGAIFVAQEFPDAGVLDDLVAAGDEAIMDLGSTGSSRGAAHLAALDARLARRLIFGMGVVGPEEAVEMGARVCKVVLEARVPVDHVCKKGGHLPTAVELVLGLLGRQGRQQHVRRSIDRAFPFEAAAVRVLAAVELDDAAVGAGGLAHDDIAQTDVGSR